MKYLSNKIRTLTLVTVIALLLAVFFYVVIRSGPLAPIAVTVTTVTNQPITPALFGIGTIQARYTHRLGPTVAGRVQNVNVQVGDKVKAEQILAEIDLAAREGFVAAGIRLEWSEEVVAAVAQAGYDPRYGARPLQRALEEMVATPLARWKSTHAGIRSATVRVELEPGGAVRITERPGTGPANPQQ